MRTERKWLESGGGAGVLAYSCHPPELNTMHFYWNFHIKTGFGVAGHRGGRHFAVAFPFGPLTLEVDWEHLTILDRSPTAVHYYKRSSAISLYYLLINTYSS